ncbi:Purple acid phosphatase 17 [Linum perenne]
MSLVSFLVFCVLTAIPSCSFSQLTRLEQQVKDDGSLSLLVIGDWGRRGLYNQSQMGRIGEELDIDFVISTGDNFYDDGLKGLHDPAFEDSFSRVYAANSLQKPWYTVLGNHDYRGDALAQLNPVLRKVDSRWLCLRSFMVDTEIASFFFVDTTPFVNNYFIDKVHTYDWRGISPRKAYLANLLKDLESALRESSARWKIVVGHHPIRSIGHHGDTQDLIQNLLPILKANNVDMYINGHDHCLEHISSHDSPIQYLTSGGGSKAWNGDIKSYDERVMKFYYDGQGFVSMQLTDTSVEVLFHDVFGQVLHRWHVSKDLHSSV